MEKLPRLSRAEVIARLRAHAAAHGTVTGGGLREHDRVVLTSIPLHFAGLPAARAAAGIPAPATQRPRNRTGPKRGAKPSHVDKPSHARRKMWTRNRVVAELRRLHREGQSTTWQDLIVGGYATLVAAAHTELGGLRRARKLAGVPAPRRRRPAGRTWTPESLLDELRRRRRHGESLAHTGVPQNLYNAARHHHGSWPAALALAGVDPQSVRKTNRRYTRAVIIDRLRAAANAGSDLRADSIRRLFDLKAIRREFGTIAAAIEAAGLTKRLANRKHRGAKWSRERMIDVLRERAERRIYTLTPGLYRVARLYFGGANEARRAAGTPDPVEVRIAERRRARRGEGSGERRRLTRAADAVVGRAGGRPITPARLIAVLQERARRGEHTITSGLARLARKYFGGVREARRAARVPEPGDVKADERHRAARSFQARHRQRARTVSRG